MLSREAEERALAIVAFAFSERGHCRLSAGEMQAELAAALDAFAARRAAAARLALAVHGEASRPSCGHGRPAVHSPTLEAR